MTLDLPNPITAATLAAERHRQYRTEANNARRLDQLGRDHHGEPAIAQVIADGGARIAAISAARIRSWGAVTRLPRLGALGKS
jgi:hypothetical protein